MKMIHKIQSFTLLAAALVMGACTDDVTRDPSPVINPETCNQAVFSMDNVSALELLPTEAPQVTVSVERKQATDAISVPVQVVLNQDGVFTDIPQTIDFAAGEAKTSFTLRFDEAQVGVSYKLVLRLAGPHADPYSVQNGTILYSIEVARINWISTGEHIGKGTYMHKFLDGGNQELVLERGEGTNLYRLKNWGGRTNLRFEAQDEAGTSFTIPAQPINVEHQEYGPISVEGTVQFDGEYTYTFNTQYFVSEGTFTSPAEKFVLDHPIDVSKFTAEFEVEPAVNEALVGVIPFENTVLYYTDMGDASVIAGMSDAALTEDIQKYLEYVAEENNITVSDVLTQWGRHGEYRYTASDLDPETEYTTYAYAIDQKTGKALSAVSRYTFKTLEGGEPTEDYLRFVGTWTVTSENSVNGGPISYEVTISQRVPNASYSMIGWTDNDEYKQDKVILKYKAGTKSIVVPNQQDFGSLGQSDEGEEITRNFMGYTTYEGDAPVMPVGGENYNAMEGVLQSDGSIELTGYTGNLQGGGTFTIVGLDFFGSGPQHVFFLNSENYGVGPYTMVKATPTPSERIEPMIHRNYRKPGKIGMSFSSAARLMQAR